MLILTLMMTLHGNECSAQNVTSGCMKIVHQKMDNLPIIVYVMLSLNDLFAALFSMNIKFGCIIVILILILIIIELISIIL